MSDKLMNDLENIIAQTAAVLKAGGLILYPTDTLWGLGCDATNEKAVRRVFDLKKRADSKSMILLIENPDSFQPYTHADMQKYRPLLQENTEPQTVIIPQSFGLAPGVMPPEKTAAVRCPKHLFCQKLLRVFEKPLISTSANLSGQPAAIRLCDVAAVIRRGVDWVVPEIYGAESTGKASRIVCLDENGVIKYLR